MTTHLHTIRRGCRQAGFTLIEALIALLVMAFGMLAIAGMQATMSRNSDLAKQRSEAVRLAQQQLERLRSFDAVAVTGVSTYTYSADVVAGGPEDINPGSGFTANTTYRRSWTVMKADGVTAAVASDLEKWINVTVAWADRTSVADNQSVTLRSVISRSDPIELGTLFTGPGATKTRTPKNRNVNIPYPSVSLPGDKSSFKPPGSTFNYVFDNFEGNVLGFCTNAAIAEALDGDGTDDILTFDNPLTVAVEATTSGCTSDPSFLLSGYVRFLNSLPGGTEANVDNGISNPSADITRDLNAFIDLSGTPPAATECFTQRQKVVSVGSITPRAISNSPGVTRSGTTATVTTTGNHGFLTGQYVSINGVTPAGMDAVAQIIKLTNTTFTYTLPTTAPASGSGGLATLIQELTIAETDTAPTDYNSVKARFVAYTCIVRPYDHDSNPATPVAWSGQFYIVPTSVTTGVPWALGVAADGVVGASNTKKVCRFTGDYKSDNKLSNSEHPRYYRGVSGTGALSPSGALDNQNYLVVPFDMTCPTDDETAPLASDYINTNTVLHQTTITVGSLGGQPSDSAQWGSGTEAANGSANLSMF